MAHLLFFLSGFAALVYEVVWLRELTLTLGKTTYSISIILAAFMGGMALGNILFGRRADSIQRPLLTFGRLEIAIGISGAVLLALFAALNPLYRFLITSLGLSITSLPALLLKPLLAGLLLTMQTVFMGGTLPVLSRHVVRTAGAIGTGIGSLYAASTLGAVVGCATAGFILLPEIGLVATACVAIVTNLALGSVAYALGRRQEAPTNQHADAPEPLAQSSGSPTAGSLPPWFVPTIYLITGATALAYEVLWTRQLLFFVRHGSYAFTIMLATFLLGLGFGSAAYARYLHDRTRPLRLFGIFQLLIALFAGAGIVLFHNLGYYRSVLRSLFGVDAWLGTTLIESALAFTLIFLPTFLFGACFPLANRLHIKRVGVLGWGVALLTAANAFGGVLGSFAAGFLLIPRLGINGSIAGVAFLNAAIGLICLWRSDRRALGHRRKTRIWAVAATAVTLATVTLVLSTTPPPITTSPSIRRREILFHREGVDASLSVLATRGGSLLLDIDGSVTAADTFTDIVVHKMLAHLPALFHAAPERALVVGFGLGVTANSLSKYPEMQRLDIVELVEDEQLTAPFFGHINEGVLGKANAHLVIGDGRDFIGTATNRYDIISFNAIHPRLGAGLYSLDFYELCRSKLAPGGVVAGWIPTNWMTKDEFRSLLRTFIEIFPNASLWYSNTAHTVILGSVEPVAFDVELLKHRLENRLIGQDLKRSYLDDAPSLLSFFLMGPTGLKSYADGARLNTDDHSHVEYTRVIDTQVAPGVIESLLEHREPVIPYLTNADSALNEQLARMFEAREEFIYAELMQWKYGLKKQARNRIGAALEVDVEDPYIAYIARGYRGERIESWEIDKPKPSLSVAVPHHDESVDLFDIGMRHYNAGELPQAVGALEAALIVRPDYNAALNNLGHIYTLVGDTRSAIDRIEKSIDLAPAAWLPRYLMAAASMRDQDTTAAIKHLEKAIELNPYYVDAFDRLAKLYASAGADKQAQELRDRAKSIDPTYLSGE